MPIILCHRDDSHIFICLFSSYLYLLPFLFIVFSSSTYRCFVFRRCYIYCCGIVAVAVAFGCCWAPFHAQRLMAVYGKIFSPRSHIFMQTYTVLTYVSGVLYFMSTCINPLLYSIMSHKFRNAFKVIKK